MSWRIRDSDDFAVAGRGLRPTVLAGTLVATWIGTAGQLGGAEAVSSSGLLRALLPLGTLAGILMLVVLSPAVRSVPAQTLPQILGVRFGPAVRRVGAAILLGCFLLVLAWQIRAAAAAASAFFPDATPTTRAVAVGAVVILLVALAGMHSVATVGALCGAFMIVATLLSAGLICRDWRAAGLTLPEPVTNLSGSHDAIFWLGAMLPGLLLVLTDANVQQRLLSAEDPRAARRGAAGMLVGVLAIEAALFVIFVLGGQLRSEALQGAPAGATGLADIAATVLPDWAAMLLIAAVLAGLLAAASSFLLSAATTAAADLLDPFRSPAWQRGCTVGLGLAALALAMTDRVTFGRAVSAYSLCGASLGPPLLLCLSRPNTSAVVGLAGMIAGAAAAAFWTLPSTRGMLPESLRDQSPLLAAVVVNVAAMGLAALVRTAFRR